MRKILFIAIAAMGLLTQSCNNSNNTRPANEGGPGEKAKKNIEAAEAIADAFRTGDLSRLDSFVAEDYVDHTERGDMNRDSLKAMVQQIRADNTDMKMEVIKRVADDEYAFIWARFTGNSLGKMMPAGPYDMKGIHVMRFRDGKVVEQWNFMEIRDMMKMMSGKKSGE